MIVVMRRRRVNTARTVGKASEHEADPGGRASSRRFAPFSRPFRARTMVRKKEEECARTMR